MKNIKLIDVLPTVFGLLAIAGLGVTMQHIVSPGPGLLMVLGGGIGSLITGLLSVLIAKFQHSSSSIHALNIVWVVAVVGFFGLMVSGFYSLRFSF
jgi:hypothetical protein